MRRTLGTIISKTCIMLAALAAPGAGVAWGAEGATHCSELLGEPAERAERAAERMEHLPYVRSGPSYIDVVHTGGYEAPAEVAYRGVVLLKTHYDSELGFVALVRIDDESGLGCPAGEYWVRRDDAFGEDAFVVAVLDDMLLLEQEGALRYVAGAELSNKPIFKLSWQSPYSIVTPRATSRTPSRVRPRVKGRR